MKRTNTDVFQSEAWRPYFPDPDPDWRGHCGEAGDEVNDCFQCCDKSCELVERSDTCPCMSKFKCNKDVTDSDMRFYVNPIDPRKTFRHKRWEKRCYKVGDVVSSCDECCCSIGCDLFERNATFPCMSTYKCTDKEWCKRMPFYSGRKK